MPPSLRTSSQLAGVTPSAKLVLASASPRRQHLLQELGLPFEVVNSDFPELSPLEAPWMSPPELARFNALGKAGSTQLKRPHQVILAADTVVALGTTVLGKPADQAQAQDYLRRLSGRIHEVYTGLALAHPENGSASLVARTRVTFRRLTAAQIKSYVQKVHVLDKAGAYAVQEESELIIAKVQGSISNVMGLPMEALAKLFLDSALQWHGQKILNS
jgi:septum formation protein